MTTAPDCSQETIDAARRGDMAAFERIVSCYEQPLYRYLYRFFDRREDVEDVVQETFLKAYRGIRSYDATKRFSTWLYSIATHAAYDWLRKRKRFPEALIIDDGDSLSETIEDRRSYTILEHSIDLERALQQLRPEYKAVLLLYYYESLTYEEMSETLGLPINTVKTHLRRAKQQLGSAMQA